MKKPGWKDRIRVHRLCRQAQREQNSQRARRLLDEASRQRGSDARPLLAQARLELEQSHTEAALRLLKRAEKQEGQNPACHLMKGQILYTLKQYPAAQDAFEQALRLDARNGLAKNLLAFCHLQQNRTEEFREMLSKEGLWHRPDLVRTAWVQRKLPVWKLHQDAVAQQEAERRNSEASSPPGNSLSPRARIAFARKALGKGRAHEAYEALLPFVDERRTNAKFAYLFAEASIRARRADKARGILESHLKRSKSKKQSDDPYLFFLLGRCCFHSGDYETSVEYYTQGEAHTTMPFYSAMFQYYSALSWLAAEEYRRAGEAIEEACRIDPLLASLIALSLTELLCRGRPLRELIDEE